MCQLVSVVYEIRIEKLYPKRKQTKIYLAEIPVAFSLLPYGD